MGEPIRVAGGWDDRFIEHCNGRHRDASVIQSVSPYRNRRYGGQQCWPITVATKQYDGLKYSGDEYDARIWRICCDWAFYGPGPFIQKRCARYMILHASAVNWYVRKAKNSGLHPACHSRAGGNPEMFRYGCSIHEPLAKAISKFSGFPLARE
jgi:hypothetical protein